VPVPPSTIITTERLIQNDEIRRIPAYVDPLLVLDAVCEVPYGSYPEHVRRVLSDEEHIKEWLKVRKPRGVQEVPRQEHLQLQGSLRIHREKRRMHKLLKLREKEFLFSKARD